MKKYLLSFILLLIFPLVVNAKNEKVKVYIYEAGGCPYCEAQVEYLKGLDSYNKKFTIVRKELYVDHVAWAKGKEYDNGVKVATGFANKGYADANYNATPFVVISDVYAATGYNTNLESYINEAYEKGDKDIVKCVESGKDNCFDKVESKGNPIDLNNPSGDSNTDTYDNGNAETSNSSKGISNSDLMWTIIICTIINLSVYIIKSNKDKYDILSKIK